MGLLNIFKSKKKRLDLPYQPPEFRKSASGRRKPKAWVMTDHRTFGDYIGWDVQRKSIQGHCLGLEDGDFLIVPEPVHQDGVGIYKLSKVRYYTDPHDMFHADAKFIRIEAVFSHHYIDANGEECSNYKRPAGQKPLY